MAREVAEAVAVSLEDPPERDTGVGEVMMAISIFTVQVSRYCNLYEKWGKIGR
ncbi:MAG: hypothetical protein GY696_07515 [Gammaproteobacteria bacterium]|nr:hypothetical protein [Gammaproteobacteria bacterium]